MNETHRYETSMHIFRINSIYDLTVHWRILPYYVIARLTIYLSPIVRFLFSTTELQNPNVQNYNATLKLPADALD